MRKIRKIVSFIFFIISLVILIGMITSISNLLTNMNVRVNYEALLASIAEGNIKQVLGKLSLLLYAIIQLLSAPIIIFLVSFIGFTTKDR